MPPAETPVKGSGTIVTALRRGRRELAAMTQGEMCVVHRVLGAQVRGREREVVEGIDALERA